MCTDPQAGGASNRIDPCLATEIHYLILAGCDPWSSCCGHGHKPAFILVHGSDSRDAASAAGYRPRPHLPGSLNDEWRIDLGDA